MRRYVRAAVPTQRRQSSVQTGEEKRHGSTHNATPTVSPAQPTQDHPSRRAVKAPQSRHGRARASSSHSADMSNWARRSHVSWAFTLTRKAAGRASRTLLAAGAHKIRERGPWQIKASADALSSCAHACIRGVSGTSAGAIESNPCTVDEHKRYSCVFKKISEIAPLIK